MIYKDIKSSVLPPGLPALDYQERSGSSSVPE